MAFDKKLFGTVCRIFMDEVFRSYSSRARAMGIESPECGGIAFLQRFGAKLNLNAHVHAVLIDGVYAGPRAIPSSASAGLEASAPELEFHPVPPPSPKEVEEVSARVAARVERVLGRRRVKGEGFETESAEALLRTAHLKDAPNPSAILRLGTDKFVLDRGATS